MLDEFMWHPAQANGLGQPAHTACWSLCLLHDKASFLPLDVYFLFWQMDLRDGLILPK